MSGSPSSQQPQSPTGPNNNNNNSETDNNIARLLQRNGLSSSSSGGNNNSNADDNKNTSAEAKQQQQQSSSSSPLASSVNNNNSDGSKKSASNSNNASSPQSPTKSNNNMPLPPVHKADDYNLVWSDVHDPAVVTVEGNPNDIWNIDDYADAKDPTVFNYPAYPLGGGVAQKAHMNFLQSVGYDLAQVPFSAARPYLKEPPPTNLPLESFDLRVIYDAGKTGFEDNKDFPITPGTIIAGRYKITEYIGSAAFSRAVQAIDLKHNAYVCVKIVRNSKDFFDQSLDEIKLLHYINCNGDPDQNHVVQLYDFFYFKEHVFLVCELLRDNLYEFGKYNREHETEPYFTLARLQKITRQILEALVYVHNLNLLHCDLKPENVLIKSYSRCEVKVIDFGSSCFTTDNLSSYIQSRCYRAPEVVLGCKYDGRIDVWSLGAMLPELATGNVLFHNDTLPQMLGRISAILGPFPPRMVREGRHSCRYITKTGLFYEVAPAEEAKKALKKSSSNNANDENNNNSEDAKATKENSRSSKKDDNNGDDDNEKNDDEEEKLVFYYPKPRKLEELCGYDDVEFIDFIRQALTIDHKMRPTAAQLLMHPFMMKKYEGAEQIVSGSGSKLTAQQQQALVQQHMHPNNSNNNSSSSNNNNSASGSATTQPAVVENASPNSSSSGVAPA